MSTDKLFGGHAIRRLRRSQGLTQLQMAERLGVSSSYLNLLERNQRALTASLLVRLTEEFAFDPLTLRNDDPGGGADALRSRLQHPIFADLSIDRSVIIDWLMSAPDTAEAFARAFDKMGTGESAAETDPTDAVRLQVERWNNHFPDLDHKAEELADELRLSSAELSTAIIDRLRKKHQITVNIVSVQTMPDRLHRLDLASRQLQISEMLNVFSSNFALAFHLSWLEDSAEIAALVRGAKLPNQSAERLFRRHLISYFAAAILMPYTRFLAACEETGYDLAIIQRRFRASFEQVAHRLTTLQRIGARGLPFFMIRIDRAGQVSKRFAGASGSPLADIHNQCPLRAVHRAFEQRGEMVVQVVQLEDDSLWFTLAQAVDGHAHAGGRPTAAFSVGLGLRADLAKDLVLTRGIDLSAANAVPIGLGCRVCLRTDCSQRAHPPQNRTLTINERDRGLTPFGFTGD